MANMPTLDPSWLMRVEAVPSAAAMSLRRYDCSSSCIHNLPLFSFHLSTGAFIRPVVSSGRHGSISQPSIRPPHPLLTELFLSVSVLFYSSLSRFIVGFWAAVEFRERLNSCTEEVGIDGGKKNLDVDGGREKRGEGGRENKSDGWCGKSDICHDQGQPGRYCNRPNDVNRVIIQITSPALQLPSLSLSASLSILIMSNCLLSSSFPSSVCSCHKTLLGFLCWI